MYVCVLVPRCSRAENSGIVMLGPAHVASNPVLVMSRLGASCRDAPEELMVWRVSSRVSFTLAGIECSGEMVALLTRMMAAHAIISTGQMFAVHRDNLADLENLEVLQSLGMVACSSGGRSTSLWHFTMEGLRSLEPCRHISNAAPALEVRNIALEKMTSLELCNVLQREGWTILKNK